MSEELASIRAVALAAVVRACKVARQVQQALVSESTITKKDASPVTVGDYSVQALLIYELSSAFPEIPFVAEEDSKTLAENVDVKKSVLQFVQQQFPEMDEGTLLGVIAKGGEGLKTAPSSKRWWTLDPIDGTLGFLRNDQYAIALALMEDNKPILGILGCPSLPISKHAKEQQGCVFYALQGEGAYMRPLDSSSSLDSITDQKISVSSQMDPKLAVFTESYVSRGFAHDINKKVVERLHVQAEPLRIDSQCKYAMVARGDSDVYLRLSSLEYKENIWDHAAGALIVEQAGGVVSDFNGKTLDYSKGVRLTDNVGIVCTNKTLFNPVLDALPKEMLVPTNH